MMTATRAKRGGEQGRNGEWYDGGQFLPSTDLPKMGRPSRGSGKQQVGPYQWEEAPNGERAIYATIAALIDWRREQVNAAACEYFGQCPERIEALYRRWKDGDKWV